MLEMAMASYPDGDFFLNNLNILLVSILNATRFTNGSFARECWYKLILFI